MALLLRHWGHQAEAAYRGDQALDRYGEARPDLVLLDVALPGMDGMEVARHLRRHEHQATLVALTGFGDARAQEATRQAGFREHLVKPVDVDTLRRVLANVDAAAAIGETEGLDGG